MDRSKVSMSSRNAHGDPSTSGPQTMDESICLQPIRRFGPGSPLSGAFQYGEEVMDASEGASLESEGTVSIRLTDSMVHALIGPHIHVNVNSWLI